MPERVGGADDLDPICGERGAARRHEGGKPKPPHRGNHIFFALNFFYMFTLNSHVRVILMLFISCIHWH
jgi:hypothetical protein